MKKYIILIFTFYLCQLLGSDAKLYLAQADLEDRIQTKITTAIAKMFNEEDFFVWAKVDLKEKIKEIDVSLEDDVTKEKAKKDPFGYDVFEGLGLSGLPSVPGVVMPGETGPASEGNYSLSDYNIAKIDISVYLSESIFDIKSRETITNFVNNEFPQVRNCFDCFRIESMPDKNNYGSGSSSSEVSNKLQSLKDSLRYAVITQERAIANQKLILLSQQLDEANSTRLFYEDQESRRRELERNLDSLQFVNLLDIEKEYRDKQNELLDNMTLDYEKAIQSRSDVLEKTNEKLFGLLEGGNDNLGDRTNDSQSELIPWDSSSKTSYIIMTTIIIILIAVAMILLKKKNIVYLKPKNSQSGNNIGTQAATNSNPAQPSNMPIPPTASHENDDVLRSEIRTLRQSAVTMSAGQKEGATQIIKDWLQDSPPSEGDSSGEEDSDKSDNKEE